MFVSHTLQEAASGLPIEDPHQPVSRPAGAEHVLPSRLLALILLHLWLVHRHRSNTALLPAGLFHLDGPGGRPHVPRPDQGLQHLCPFLHPQVLHCRMG